MQPLHIDGKYYLNRDKYNWILQEAYQQAKRKNPDTGELEEIDDEEIRFRDVGYYPTLLQLCNRFAELETRATPAESLTAHTHATESLAAAFLRRTTELAQG